MRRLIIVAAMAASVTAATTGGDARAAMIPNAGIATAASEAIPCRKRNMFGVAVTIAGMAMAGVGPAGTGVATLGVGVLAGAAAGMERLGLAWRWLGADVASGKRTAQPRVLWRNSRRHLLAAL